LSYYTESNSAKEAIMRPISSTTGHNPEKEKKVARALYITIAVAVLAGLVMFFVMGKSRPEMNPYKSDEINKSAPDSIPGSTEKPGTVPDPAAPIDR